MGLLVLGSGGRLVFLVWGLGSVEIVCRNAGSDWGGFHALHWNMLSWPGVCRLVLRGFLVGSSRGVVVIVVF